MASALDNSESGYESEDSVEFGNVDRRRGVEYCLNHCYWCCRRRRHVSRLYRCHSCRGLRSDSTATERGSPINIPRPDSDGFQSVVSAFHTPHQLSKKLN